MRYFVLITLLFFGCQNVTLPEKPDDLIPEDKMADIMVDAYLGNAAKSINTWLLKNKGVQMDEFLYRKHEVDSMQFVRSNAYYTSNLDLYNSLFSKVEAKLLVIKEEKDSLKAAYDKEQRLKAVKRDSARKGKTPQDRLIEAVESHPHQDSIE